MTRNEIINIARAVGYPLAEYEGQPYIPPMLGRLLEAAAGFEREECAKLLDANAKRWKSNNSTVPMVLYTNASAIRARGK